MIKRVFLYIVMVFLFCGTVYAGKAEEQDFTPPGGKALNAPPPPGFSLMCFVCKKNPPPKVVDLCEDGDEGQCDDESCDPGMECVDYRENHHGQEIDCHYCANGPSACQKLGHYSNDNCDGECSEGDTCEQVDVDRDSGRIVPGGFTRAKGSTIPCYVCKPHPVVTPPFCDKEGMWSDPSCDGQCPTGGDCTPLTINTKTHSIVNEGQTVTDPVQTCYVCTSHKVNVERSICTEEGYYIDESCDGKCPADYCNEENIDTQTGDEIPPGDPVNPDTSHVCFSCSNPHEYPTSTACPEEGYYSQSSCNGKCPESDCAAKNIDSQSGEVIPPGDPVNPDTSHVCYECNTHHISNIVCPDGSVEGSCPSACSSDQDCVAVSDGCAQCNARPMTTAQSHCDVGDEGTCTPNPCPNGQQCKMITKKSNGAPYDCYMCKESSTAQLVCPEGSVPGSCLNACPYQDCVTVSSGCVQCKPFPVTAAKKKTCEDMGMSDGESCSKSCVPKGGACVPNSEDDYGTKCWECQEHKIAFNPCGTDGKLGQCPADCGSSDDCIQLPGQCYKCKEHYTTGPKIRSGCYFGKEGTCLSDPCSSDQECEMVSQLSHFDLANCYICKDKPKTVTETPPPTYTTPGGGQISENHCDIGDEGSCSPNPCSYNQDCKMVTKKSNGAPYDCHLCKEKPTNTSLTPSCWDYGYYNTTTCNNECSPAYCEPESVDTTNGEGVPYGETAGSHPLKTCYYCAPSYREEMHACHYEDYYYSDDCAEDCPPDACREVAIDGTTGEEVPMSALPSSVYYCYDCMPFDDYVEKIKEEYWNSFYVLVVDEDTYVRYVLDASGSDPSAFQPSSVMALAKVDPSTGEISNVSGNLQAITSFVGGLNVGVGPGGITSTGTVSMSQLSGALGSGLKAGGDYGDSCFNNVKKAADQEASSKGTATSDDISKGKQNDQDNSPSEKAYSPDQIQRSDDAGAPAISGPVIACGTQKGKKVLQVYDSSGKLVASITQEMLRSNPDIIAEQLSIAQNYSDGITSGKSVHLGAASKDSGSSNASSSTGRPQEPNDPLYPPPKQAPKKQSSSLFSFIFSGSNATVPVNADGAAQTQTADMVENGDGVTNQYYLPDIGYTPLDDPNSAWNAISDITQKNVVVALVDSGLDLSHPDGPQYIWTNPDGSHGWNFVNDNADVTDYRGHGTFVAGIIAAKWNNGTGIAGINPGAVIMPIKVTDALGRTTSLNIYRGINYAVDHGAKIINVSLGGVTISKLEQEAIARANAKGALVVIAAGNTSNNLMEFGPSSSPYGLAVGMTDMGGKERSLVSSWGPNLGLVAPGEKIISLCSKDAKDVLPSIRRYGYMKQSGTSFTAPMVTATASLILAKNPGLTAEQIADIIRSTATSLGEGNWNDQTGFGFLNATAALQAVPGQGVVAMITNIHVNDDNRDRISSVDVYATVRGDFKQFTLEAARNGSSSFRQVAGPFQTSVDYRLIARLDIRKVLYGSKEWRFRIKVLGRDGKEYTAVASFNFPDK